MLSYKHNRPLSKLALEDEVRGETARRTGVYTQVHEDSSTGSTKQFASKVEFRKRSNIGHKIQRYYQKIKIALQCFIPILLLLTTSCVSDVVNDARHDPRSRTATGEVSASTKEMVMAEMQQAWHYYMLASQQIMTLGNDTRQQQATAITAIFLSEWFLGLNYINSVVPPTTPTGPPTLTIVCPV